MHLVGVPVANGYSVVGLLLNAVSFLVSALREPALETHGMSKPSWHAGCYSDAGQRVRLELSRFLQDSETGSPPGGHLAGWCCIGSGLRGQAEGPDERHGDADSGFGAAA